MLRALLLIVLLVLLLELSFLVWMVHAIGWGPTIVLGVVSTLAGGSIAQRQRARAWRGWQAALASGRVPAADALEPLLLLASGVLLLVPGFLTDIAGLLLLASPVRSLLLRWLRPSLERRFSALIEAFGPRGAPARGAPPGVIDTEGEAVPGSEHDVGARPQLR